MLHFVTRQISDKKMIVDIGGCDVLHVNGRYSDGSLQAEKNTVIDQCHYLVTKCSCWQRERRCGPGAGSILSQRLRRWPSIETASGHCIEVRTSKPILFSPMIIIMIIQYNVQDTLCSYIYMFSTLIGKTHHLHMSKVKFAINNNVFYKYLINLIY